MRKNETVNIGMKMYEDNVINESIPNLLQMEKWISSEIFDQSGGLYSWQRGNEKGYLYNEITGYGVKLYMYLYDVFKDPRYLEMAQKSVKYLYSQMHDSGAISRGGIYYVFDASICLSGILSYYDGNSTRKRYMDENRTKKLLDFIYYSLLKKKPINLNGASQIDLDMNHWSLNYGSHLLKCCISLSQSSNAFMIEKEKIDGLINNLCIDILHNFHDGHFYTHSNSQDVYTHSHCYATEGLIYLNRYEHLNIIKESANWLAEIQNSDGSIYNRYFSLKDQEKVADVTAQAIRIWLWTDREKFCNNIEKSFSFLKSLQSPEGGIYYKKGSMDINSWVTMFTINAILWYNNGVDTKWLI